MILNAFNNGGVMQGQSTLFLLCSIRNQASGFVNFLSNGVNIILCKTSFAVII